MAESTQGTRRHRARAWLRRLALATALAGGAAGAAGAWGYHTYVVRNPGVHLDRDHIYGILAQESPVYYRDGTTRVGVFFEDEHRSYVGWEELPQAYVASIVAAEDARFWSHPGFDPVHIARAMRDNFRAGKLVAGGSTLTQQTAKNLYYRPDRSLRSKLTEGLNALRLERHYSKPEILTLYANQFHVSGNGRGLGIAARHFFDATPSELGVLESAFLAGLVKAPSYYDPFIGDAERRERAITRAHDRTRYVLRRLTEVDAEVLAGPYPARGDEEGRQAYATRVVEVRRVKVEARRLLDEGFELPFQRGVFRYDSSAVLDEVARRLAEPPFDEVLQTAGIEDPATAGLKVITTLDVEAQRAATYGLWHHLTEVGVMLEGRGVEDFVREGARGPRYDPDHLPQPWTFRLANVAEVKEDEGRKHLVVDLGGISCTVDRNSIVRAAVAVHRGQVKSSTAKTNTAGANALVDALGVGTVVWVSVREVNPEGAFCDLELRPELQGSVMVMEEGEIRAMVGGNDNRNFNRSGALRQMGSTWKPLIFHAAMTLGWTPSDVLDNRRGVFPFSTSFYYPRPDHAPEDEVTLAWAGVRSENLASVWLLYHLIDRLPFERVASLAAAAGLARGEDEGLDAYKLRIQQAGVLPTPSRRRESHFLEARYEVLSALSGTTRRADGPSLMSLLYGTSFDAERRRASTSSQRAALDWSWGPVRALQERCKDQHTRLLETLEVGAVPPAGSLPELTLRRTEDGVLELACGEAPDGFVPVADASLWDDTAEEEEVEGPPGATAEGGLDRRGLFGLLRPKPRRAARRVVDVDAMWVDGRLRSGTLDEVASALTRLTLQHEVQGAEAPGLYDPKVLYWHQDFRVLLALRYVRGLAAQYGVQSDIQEVMSIPLGASEITLEETALLYEGLTSGVRWKFPGVASGPGGTSEVSEPAGNTLLIKEIRDVDDNVIYRARPSSEEVASVDVAAMTTDVLHHVVRHGTGRRAQGIVQLAGQDLPMAGKTGTTNAFRNAVFAGIAPIAAEAGLEVGRSQVVAVYVGYDDNRPMVSGGIKLAGASGALPAWVTTVRGLAAAQQLGRPSNAPDDGWTYRDPAQLTRLSVDTSTGLVVEPSELEGGVAQVLTRPPAPVLASTSTSPEPIFPWLHRLVPRTIAPAGEPATQDERMKKGQSRGGVWAPFKRKRQRQEDP